MHFCTDEMNALLALIPGVGFLIAWLKGKWHHHKHHAHCDDTKKIPGTSIDDTPANRRIVRKERRRLVWR